MAITPNVARRNVMHCMKSPLFLSAEMLPTRQELHVQYSTSGVQASLSQVVIHFKLILRCLCDGGAIAQEILEG
jgi:hypothetical protein